MLNLWAIVFGAVAIVFPGFLLGGFLSYAAFRTLAGLGLMFEAFFFVAPVFHGLVAGGSAGILTVRWFPRSSLNTVAITSPLILLVLLIAALASFQPLKGTSVVGGFLGFLWGAISVVCAAGTFSVVVWGEGQPHDRAA